MSTETAYSGVYNRETRGIKGKKREAWGPSGLESDTVSLHAVRSACTTMASKFNLRTVNG